MNRFGSTLPVLRLFWTAKIDAKQNKKKKKNFEVDMFHKLNETEKTGVCIKIYNMSLFSIFNNVHWETKHRNFLTEKEIEVYVPDWAYKV